MSKHFKFFFTLGLSFFPIGVLGAESGIKSDVSAGIAFPSHNSSVIENPAAIPSISSKRGDIGAFFIDSSSQGGRGGVVGKVSSAGLGFEISRTGQNDNLDLGLGIPVMGSFQLGFGYNRSITTSTNTFSLGSRFQVSSKIAAGLVFEDLNSLPGNWIFGMGGQLGNQLTLESDFEFIGAQGTLEPSAINTALSLVYAEDKKLSFKFGIVVPTYPNFDFSLADPIIGISFWPSQKFGIYFLMNDTPTQYVIGIKFL